MADMPLKMRTSKFRHVYGQSTRKENSFENIRITKNAHDSNFCAVNPKFLAVVTESVGGGAFLVIKIKQIGRVDVSAPKVCGHAGPITDIKWNPFDDNIIASCSDDMTIKVWEIPELGLVANTSDWLVELRGHGRKVTYIEWHPSAENILLSTAFDYRCIIWNVGAGEPLNVISCHSNTIYSISWNDDGSLFATSCKDKKLRVIDARSGRVISEGNSHYGLKTCKVVFLRDNKLFSTGFSKTGDREYALWDATNLSEPLHKDAVDYSSGVLLPFYDPDINLIYLAGKGDGNIRFYEVHNDELIYLNQYPSSDPQRGLGMMPKRGLDVTKCEIARFYKLHTAKQIIEPLPMIVPRRSDEFQGDIYPPTAANTPALSAEEWASGIDRDPVKISVKVYFKLRLLERGLSLEIVDRTAAEEPSRVGSLRNTVNIKQKQVTSVHVRPMSPPPKAAPASLQNIYKLSTEPSNHLNVQSSTNPQYQVRTSPSPAKQIERQQSPPQQQQPQQQRRFQQQQWKQVQSVQPQSSHTSQQSPQESFTKRPDSTAQPSQQRLNRSPEKSPPAYNAKWRDNNAWQKPAAPTADTRPSWQQHLKSNGHSTARQPSPADESTVPLNTESSSSAPSLDNYALHKWLYEKINFGETDPPATVVTGGPPNSVQSADQDVEQTLTSEVHTTLNLVKPSPPQRGSSYQQVQQSGYEQMRQDMVDSFYDNEIPQAAEGRRSRSRERSSDLPLAYKFTSSIISGGGQGQLSEVERKKKVRGMRQKVQRSSSAGRVETQKSPSPSVELSGNRTPPNMVSHSRSASVESMEEERKRIVSEKLEELRRMRDLAKAYAEGNMADVSSKPVRVVDTNNRDSAPSVRTQQNLNGGTPPWQGTPKIQRKPVAIGAPGKQVEQVYDPPTSPIIRSPTCELPNTTSLPSWVREDNSAYAEICKDLHYSNGMSLYEKKQVKSPILPKRKPVAHHEPVSPVIVRRALDTRQSQVSQLSAYDNEIPDEQLPKFPVPTYGADGRGTLYDNMRKKKKGAISLGLHEQNEDIKDFNYSTTSQAASQANKSASQQSTVQLSKSPVNGGASQSLANDELHKTYFKQCEEIKQLRQSISAKDKKIEQLERELGQLKKMIISLQELRADVEYSCGAVNSEQERKRQEHFVMTMESLPASPSLQQFDCSQPNRSLSSPISTLSINAKAFSIDALLSKREEAINEEPLLLSVEMSEEEMQRDEEDERTDEAELESLDGEDVQGIAEESCVVPPSLENIKCMLEMTELWKKFHELGTEMIITKSGRRMFPSLRVSFSNLDPKAMYQVYFDVSPVDNKRYRYAYHRSSWLVAGRADPPIPRRVYSHPDGPFTGESLQKQSLSFEKVKLTNNLQDKWGYIIMNSMHKYQPRIHLVKFAGEAAEVKTLADLQGLERKIFIFTETQFIGVTAYQNQLITKLKIDSNPFAKGFRDSARITQIDRESVDLLIKASRQSNFDSQMLLHPPFMQGPTSQITLPGNRLPGLLAAGIRPSPVMFPAMPLPHYPHSSTAAQGLSKDLLKYCYDQLSTDAKQIYSRIYSRYNPYNR